jgi:hypothetical protein
MGKWGDTGLVLERRGRGSDLATRAEAADTECTERRWLRLLRSKVGEGSQAAWTKQAGWQLGQVSAVGWGEKEKKKVNRVVGPNSRKREYGLKKWISNLIKDIAFRIQRFKYF